MKLKEFLENFTELIKKNPEALDYEVVSSADDEGNSFGKVHFSPTIGIFNDCEFKDAEHVDDEYLSKVNAVCIN